MNTSLFDVVVIGGGINGCGCAADAALRGLKVALIEQGDLASQTSSKSTKLIHGGLRYLEQFDLKLVKKSLQERETLRQLAPHLVHPQAFVLPHQKPGRSSWLLMIGLFLYDRLSASNTLPKSQWIRAKKNTSYFTPLSKRITQGCLFYDCTTSDSRLTVVNALQAHEHRATIMTHTTLTKAETHDGVWQLTLKPQKASTFQLKTRAVINCAGPWVNQVSQILNIPPTHDVSLVKGSHLLVNPLYEGQQAYLLQYEDKRIVFAIPYHGYTLVGTTEVNFTGSPFDVQMDAKERTYLRTIINHHFKKTIDDNDIVAHWSGLRTLVSDPQQSAHALSRDYLHHLTQHPAPAITVYGGKLTTYRLLASEVIDQLNVFFPDLPDSITHQTPLPGAVFPGLDFTTYRAYAKEKYPWLDQETLSHYLDNYGTRTEQLLQEKQSIDDLGHRFAPRFYQAEVDYLLKHEWAVSSEDILWRRTKLALSVGDDVKQALDVYLA